jgi:hypothetical protein
MTKPRSLVESIQEELPFLPEDQHFEIEDNEAITESV